MKEAPLIVGEASAVVQSSPQEVFDFVIDLERHRLRSGARSPGSGQGLTGMWERSESLGREFEARARPGIGGRVWASLPIPSGDAPDAPDAPDATDVRDRTGEAGTAGAAGEQAGDVAGQQDGAGVTP